MAPPHPHPGGVVVGGMGGTDGGHDPDQRDCISILDRVACAAIRD
jgi:hypothetical protein